MGRTAMPRPRRSHAAEYASGLVEEIQRTIAEGTGKFFGDAVAATRREIEALREDLGKLAKRLGAAPAEGAPAEAAPKHRGRPPKKAPAAEAPAKRRGRPPRKAAPAKKVAACKKWGCKEPGIVKGYCRRHWMMRVWEMRK
jgi:hypothetical protein